MIDFKLPTKFQTGRRPLGSKKISNKIKIGLVLVLLIGILVVLNLTPLAKEIKGFFYFISAPIQKSLFEIGDRASDFFEAIVRIKKLKKENKELLLRNQELLAQIVLLKEKELENKTLREALAINLQEEFKLDLAYLIGKDISQDFILIDKGEREGIKEGMTVITSQKVLSGKITQVYKNFSKARLVFDKGSSFDAKISGKEIYGVIKGRGNSKLLLDLIPAEAEVKEGDLVVTTSLGGIFPKGLLVGEIEKIKKSDLEAFQQAEIKSIFNLEELKTVFIITDKE